MPVADQRDTADDDTEVQRDADDGRDDQNSDTSRQQRFRAPTNDEASDSPSDHASDPNVLFEALPEPVRAQARLWHEAETAGLRRAIDTERQRSKDFERDLARALRSMEPGGEMYKQLRGLSDQLKESNFTSAFYEAAVTKGVARDSLKLALIAANEGRFVDRRNNTVDWEALKSAYPKLFVQETPRRVPPSGAGNGQGERPPAGGFDMNSAIREKFRG